MAGGERGAARRPGAPHGRHRRRELSGRFHAHLRLSVCRHLPGRAHRRPRRAVGHDGGPPGAADHRPAAGRPRHRRARRRRPRPGPLRAAGRMGSGEPRHRQPHRRRPAGRARPAQRPAGDQAGSPGGRGRVQPPARSRPHPQRLRRRPRRLATQRPVRHGPDRRPPLAAHPRRRNGQPLARLPRRSRPRRRWPGQRRLGRRPGGAADRPGR